MAVMIVAVHVIFLVCLKPHTCLAPIAVVIVHVEKVMAIYRLLC